MLFPWFGYLGTRNYSLSGSCFDQGFILNIHKGHQSVTVKVGIGKENTTYHTGPINIFAFLLGYATWYQICTIIYAFDVNFVAKLFIWSFSFLSCIGLWLLTISGIHRIFSRRNTREWHACEHKNAVLIEAGLPINRENLKRAPKTLVRCGSVLVVLWWEIITMVWLIPFLICLLPYDHFLVLTSILFFISAISAKQLRTVRNAYLISPFLPLILPALILPLINQYLFAVKNPSEEKTSLTVQQLQEITETLNIFTQK